MMELLCTIVALECLWKVEADDLIPVLVFSESPEVPWIEPHDIDDLKQLFKKKAHYFTSWWELPQEEKV